MPSLVVGSRRGGKRLFAWLLLPLCGLASPSQVTSQVTLGASANPTAGARVYGSLGCPQCHSVNGYGAGTAPDLAHSEAARSVYALGTVVWNHAATAVSGSMPLGGWRVHEAEVRDLLAFLLALSGTQPIGDAESGAVLFEERGCQDCHQVGGVGGVEGPSLDHLRMAGSPIQVVTAMWNHGPTMHEHANDAGHDWPTLTGSAFEDLVAYLEAGAGGVSENPVFYMAGEPARGRALFEEKACAQCHRGGIAPSLAGRLRSGSLMDLAATMWNHQPDMEREARRMGIQVPVLTPGEMADLVGYLYSLRYLSSEGSAQRGPARIRTGGCLDCHTLGGAGTGSAPDLSSIRGLHSPPGALAALWNHGPLAASAGTDASPLRALEPAAMADIVAYLIQRSGGGS